MARFEAGDGLPGFHGRDAHMTMPRTRATALLVGLALGASVTAQSKQLERSALPPAVEKTVAAESQGATITRLSTEIEDGRRIYEVAFTTHGHARSVEIDARGTLLETEDEVSLATVPPAVKAALLAAAGTGTIERVDTLTKKGTLVAYEAQVKRGATRSEIQVGPDGKKLAHPE
jgi:hypothetical protein